MIKKLVFVGLCATLLAGCSATTGGAGPKPTPTPTPDPVPVHGPAGSAQSTNLTPNQVLQAYTQTFATTPNFNVTTAQANGLAGYAAGPALPTAAAASSSFKSAVVKISEDRKSLEIAVEGNRFPLKQIQAAETFTINGQKYTGYRFSTSGNNPSNQTTQNYAELVNGQYASVAAFARNVGTFGPIHSNDGFIMIATGGETPVNNMPSQIAHYGGRWFTITNTTHAFGDFTAEANFANDKLTWTASNSNNSFVDRGAAKIDGNRFVGDLNFGTPGINDKAQVVGSFYGPNADEIAGVVSGNITINDQVTPVGGGFIGNKNPSK